MSGWIKIHRKIQEHWICKENRVYSNFEAWVDILLTVNHADAKMLIKGTLFHIKRGESINSLDTWAKRWNWNKSKARRFLNLLKSENMIALKNEHKTTRLSVCNYDSYQDTRNADETQTKRKRNADETLATPNKNVKNDKGIDIRKQEFATRVKSFESKYPIEMLREFYLYWSEHSDNGKKMRYEMQKVFNIERRLITWSKNQQKFDTPNQPQTDTRVDHVTSSIKKYYPDHDFTKRT